jgi:hypothetical protein
MPFLPCVPCYRPQYLLSMRVLLSEALCVWQRHRLSLGLKGLGLSGEKLVTGTSVYVPTPCVMCDLVMTWVMISYHSGSRAWD